VLDHGGVLTTNKVISYVPEQTVLGLAPGTAVALGTDDLERLGEAFLAHLEKRFRADE
jgi:hypothetical protein